MKEKIKIWHTGITASEEKTIPKLKIFLRQGYTLTKLNAFYYELSYIGEQTEQDYLLDIHKELDDHEEYLASMEKTGWNLAAYWDEFFYFKGASGTKPIYSDTYKDVKNYEAIRKSNMGISYICAFFVFILTVVAMSFPSLLKGGYGIATIIAGIFIILFFLSSLKTSIDYEKRIKRVKEREKPF